MKKVINRKMYNTETATFIAGYTFSSPRDFKYFSEELYITMKGNYFLYGRGGALSKYAKKVGTNEHTGGWDIIPMTEGEAFNWCKKNECTGAIELYFKEYNDARAVAIHIFDPPKKFGPLCELLYITPKGNYLLYRQGTVTDISHEGANNITVDEWIKITEEEAYNWCKDKECMKVIEKYFIEYVEGV